jgi:pyridoxal phosphate enzyme (YggS family)
MNSIKQQLDIIKEELPDGCTLVAVSKTKPNEDIMEAYGTGHRDFGENKVQELTKKADDLPKDIKWHMIGHLQRNKVKYIVPIVHLIHGVDSMKLLVEINKQSEKNNQVTNCLLQIHIASEETKFGFNDEEIKSIIQSHDLSNLKYIKIVGLMGMATNSSNEDLVAKEFNGLKNLYGWVEKNSKHSNVSLQHLSMGMSGDFKIALREGSNMVRIGSSIFGSRNY